MGRYVGSSSSGTDQIVLKQIDDLVRSGSTLESALKFARTSAAFWTNESAVTDAFNESKARSEALQRARAAMASACPHPIELRDERDGSRDSSGCSWGSEFFCAACNADLPRP
jgi:hypothetical protein